VTEKPGERRARLVVTRSANDIQQGDELVRIGDHKIANRFDVERAFWGKKPTDAVKVTIRRDGKEQEIAIKLGRSEERDAAKSTPGTRKEPGRETLPAGR
jgi:S1-C subfamily serine protease